MIFKKTKKFREALIENGYLVSNRNKNGEFLLLKKVINKFDIFFDIGFYKGEISNYVRKVSKDISIFGFDLNSFDKKTFLKNKKKNIILKNYCVLENNKKTRYFFYPKRPELSSIAKRKDYNPYISENFLSRNKSGKKIISIISDLKLSKKKEYFIKIDTDGYEYKIIFSLKKYLPKYSFAGYFEYGSGWKNYNLKLKELFYFLKKNKYNIYRLCKSGVIEIRFFSELDENYYQSHFFFTKKDINFFFNKFKFIDSLSSDTKEKIYY